MSESVSGFMGIMIIIILLILLPLYNIFERQDDSVYALALKATTNFVDEVAAKGYLTKEMYTRYQASLGTSGVTFDIELEAHKKRYDVLKDNKQESNVNYEIDYTQHIIDNVLMATTPSNLKYGNVYTFNIDDYFYIRMRSNNITQATLMFSLLGGEKKAGKINVNYGSIIRGKEWLEENKEVYIPAGN